MTVKYTREHEWIRIEGDTAMSGSPFMRKNSSVTLCLWNSRI